LDFVEIDGSRGEGGGQVIRTAVSLASICQKPIRVTNIRAKRSQKGLRPQHLQSVVCAAKLCNAVLSGAAVGSTEITFTPGKLVKSFAEKIDTGTAGSISLIMQTIIPISLFGRVNLRVSLVGGTEVPHSPTIDYIMRIVVPVYERLGAEMAISLDKRGYYPRGGGVVRLECVPRSESRPIVLENGDENNESKSVSVFSCSRVLPDHVARRQAISAKNLLENKGFKVLTEIDGHGSSLSPGSSVLVYRVTESQFIGSSALGERGKASERVGEEAVMNFLGEIELNPSVDSHLADMLVTLLSCVKGRSEFTTSKITDHFTTNVEVASKISGCKVEHHKEGMRWLVTVEGSSEKSN
jgi:RNA 3'-terminal phosphate cyclase (ATP)